MEFHMKIMAAQRLCSELNKDLYNKISPELRAMGLRVGEHSGGFCFSVYKTDGSLGLKVSVPPDI